MVRVWSSGQSPVWYRTEVMQYRVTADCVWVEWMCVAGRFFFGSISVFVLYFLVMDENSGTLTSHTSFVCVCVCLSLLFFCLSIWAPVNGGYVFVYFDGTVWFGTWRCLGCLKVFNMHCLLLFFVGWFFKFGTLGHGVSGFEYVTQSCVTG